eukprot:5193630-Heterocapsa_arctica.AAC.1
MTIPMRMLSRAPSRRQLLLSRGLNLFRPSPQVIIPTALSRPKRCLFRPRAARTVRATQNVRPKCGVF